jgi:hypothetical protein
VSADAAHLTQIVTRQEYRLSRLSQGKDLIAHELLACWIETKHWLVKQEQRRIAQEGLSQSQALEHSSRTGIQAPVRDLF